MKNKPVMTWLFLAIQIVLYLLMEVMGGSENTGILLLFGAKYAPLIADGQWWRLITPIFLHIGFNHILINSLTLYFLGQMVEKIVGHFKFAVIYLASGIMGNAMSYQFSPNVSAGASTAIFGLFTVFLALAILYPRDRYIQYLSQQYRLLIIINIVLNLFSNGVDIWGHLGGILGGFLVTFIVMKGQNNGNNFLNRLFATAVYVGVVSLIILNHGIYHTF